MASFEGKPVTNKHPAGVFVNSKNVKKFQVGFSKSVAKAEDGKSIEAELLIQDEETIKDINSGMDQVSLGYDIGVNWNSGNDAKYGLHDGSMQKIRGNHIAIVPSARAGSGFRLQDNSRNNEGAGQMKVRVIDGVSVELSDDAATIFDSMRADNMAKNTEIEKLNAQVKDQGTELETVKGERDAAKKSSVTDAEVAKLVDAKVKAQAYHTSLVDSASKVIKDFKAGDKKDLDIQKEIIVALDSSFDNLDGETDEYVKAVCDTLTKTARTKANAIADSLSDTGKGTNVTVADSDESRKKMKNRRSGTTK